MNVKVPAGFTLDQLLEQLRSRPEDAPGFKTLHEWGDELGVSYRAMIALAQQAQKAGLLKVTKVVRVRLDGVQTWVPAYHFEVKAAPANGKRKQAAQ